MVFDVDVRAETEGLLRPETGLELETRNLTGPGIGDRRDASAKVVNVEPPGSAAGPDVRVG